MKSYSTVEILRPLNVPPREIPPPPPSPPSPVSSGRWVDIARDGSTIALGASTPSFTGGAIHMCRGEDFLTVTSLTTTLDPVIEYGNGVATNADGSIVVCGALHDTYPFIDGFAAVRYGTDWANEIWLEPAGASAFLCYGFNSGVAISDDGSIIVLTDGSKLFICSGVDWGDVDTITVSDGVYSLAISGDGTVIAAGNSYDKVNLYSGASYSTHTVISPSGGVTGTDEFGWSVALNSDGSVLAVGNPSNGSGQRGAGYIFSGAGWATEQKFFVASGPYNSPSEYFGWACDISADASVAAFSAYNRSPTGVVFRESGSGYSVETETLRPSGGSLGEFGLGVALNEDGSIMAVSENGVWVFTF